MFRLYKYLYCRLYIWDKNTWGRENGSEWNALFGVSYFQFANIFLLQLFIPVKNLNFFLSDKDELIVAIMIFLIGMNYLLFIYQKSYLKYAEKIQDEPPKLRFRNAILLWLYGILSHLIPIAIAKFNINHAF